MLYISTAIQEGQICHCTQHLGDELDAHGLHAHALLTNVPDNGVAYTVRFEDFRQALLTDAAMHISSLAAMAWQPQVKRALA